MLNLSNYYLVIARKTYYPLFSFSNGFEIFFFLFLEKKIIFLTAPKTGSSFFAAFISKMLKLQNNIFSWI